MVKLSAEWSYISPGERIRCDRLVSGLGRRAEPRGSDRRAEQRQCSWFLVQVGQHVALRIRIVATKQPLLAPPPSGSIIRCRCNTTFEFEEIPVRAFSQVPT